MPVHDPETSLATSRERPPQRTQHYDFTEQVGYLLRRAYHRHLAIFQENAVDPQLTSVQFSTLSALRDRGPSSQAELVVATDIDQATIRGIIERLDLRGLIALGKDPEDGRKVVIAITDAGQRLFEDMIPRAIGITELTYAGLNPAERVALVFLLKKII